MARRTINLAGWAALAAAGLTAHAQDAPEPPIDPAPKPPAKQGNLEAFVDSASRDEAPRPRDVQMAIDARANRNPQAEAVGNTRESEGRDRSSTDRDGRGEWDGRTDFRTKENHWRYRHHNGHWWYWLPSDCWVFWHDGRWVDYDPARYYSYYPRVERRYSYAVERPYRYPTGYRVYDDDHYYRSRERWYPGYDYGDGGYHDGYHHHHHGYHDYDYGRRVGAGIGAEIGGHIGGDSGAALGAVIGAAIGDDD